MLIIKDKITLNAAINSYGYVTYLALLCLIKKNQKLYYITPNLLAFYLTDNLSPSRTITDGLYNGIKNLSSKNINFITINPKIDDIKKKYEWIADLSSISVDKELYTPVDMSDIKTIISKTAHFGNAISMVRFYVYLLSTIHKKKDDLEGVGFTSVEKMTTAIGIDQKTVYSYMDKLVSYKLISVYKAKCSVLKKDGKVKEIPATYGKYENMKKIIEVGKLYENKIETKISKRNKNNVRSLSQKYNYIENCINQGKEMPYNYDECKEIYYALRELNKKYITEGRESRNKELDMFKNYDFYIEEEI